MNEIRDILRSMDYGPAPEESSIVEAWFESKNRRFGHYIGGSFIRPRGSESFAVFNPATGEQIAEVANGSAKDVDAAFQAAKKAFAGWSSKSGQERSRILYAIARQVQKHSRFLAVLEAIDNGKPIRETRDIDIPLVARHFYHHAGWAALADSEFADYTAAGVCGQVIPWNFPLLMLAWKVAPALAAGCTVVLKPAEFTPLTATAFAEICREAGLPDGVFNVVNGDGATGAAVVEHDGFDKIAFTGSTEVGRHIRKATAGTGKKLSLELGGKSPFIVFEDADLDGAVEGVVDAIWFNQGQVCCAGSRLLVQEGVAEKFYAKLKARMEKLRVGDPLDKAIDMGSLVAPVQWDRVDTLVKKGIEEGAARWCPSWTVSDKGSFYPPTLFTGVDPASVLAQEEIFGPVLVATTFRTPDEAVSLANNTRYGLAASIWSQTIDVAFDAARAVKAGVVWINSTNLFDAMAGFGGYRESGFGREGGREGMFEYLKPAEHSRTKMIEPAVQMPAPLPGGTGSATALDRTAKFYIGGKQVRPDSGYSDPVFSSKGVLISEVGRGNRKDIRNAVEAAHGAKGWGAMTGHQRAQVLYFLAENLQIRAEEFAARLTTMTGASSKSASAEVSASVARIIDYAAWADKYDGAVRAPQSNMLSLALNEPFGVIGISCPDEAPLLAFVSLVMPAIAMGNRVVVIPSPIHPLAAADFYQVLETSDVPAGVVNIINGARDELAQVLARHDDVSCCWYVGPVEGSKLVEFESAGNLKSTWVNHGKSREWLKPTSAEKKEYLRHACQIKTIWTPFGA